MRMSTPRQRVITYVVVFVVAFALAAHYAAPKAGSGASAFVVMWTPALAALAASVLTRRSLGAIGWRLWPVKWLAAGWVIPILYAFPAYALVWLVGLGSVPSPTFLERARFTLGMPSAANWLVIVSAFGYIALVNLPPNMILTLGEEIGWRGFLVPELTTWVGFRRAGLYSGVIWGAWHLPGILTGAYGTSGTPKAYQLVCFTILVITSAVVQAWLRMRSGSVWPSTIMHATHNASSRRSSTGSPPTLDPRRGSSASSASRWCRSPRLLPGTAGATHRRWTHRALVALAEPGSRNDSRCLRAASRASDASLPDYREWDPD